jgi:hypothetical protein
MELVRDILDVRLVDRNRQGLGRVDGIILELRDGAPPRFVAMEVGAVTLARRIHPRVARLVRWLGVKFSPVPLRAMRFDPQLFRDIGVDIELDVDASTEPRLLRFEKWLRRHVVRHLPGGCQ